MRVPFDWLYALVGSVAVSATFTLGTDAQFIVGAMLLHFGCKQRYPPNVSVVGFR